jgi:SAM-dependent methyltransferase
LKPGARRIYGSVKQLADRRRQALVPPPPVTFPPDVADEEAVRGFLLKTNIFPNNPAEADAYLSDALNRFRISMALVPDLPEGTKVLELGSNPYFMTRLLRRRGLDVTCANWFGPNPEFGTHARQTIGDPASGEEEVFEFDHFNVESDRFPYDDNSFGVVLFCEILEHLPEDPIHVLAEIHRVLRKDDGLLLLTTPNAARFQNLELVERGENMYEGISGYGTYGRHNREYTVAELQRLLEDIGFVVDQNFAMETHHGLEQATVAPGVDPANRGFNLFTVARPVGEARWRYPGWLFQSRQALYGRYLPRPDLAMGYNDDLQSLGFHDLEQIGGVFLRWMGALPVARAKLVPAASGPATLRIQGMAAPAALGRPVELRAKVGTETVKWEIPSDSAFFDVTAAVTAPEGTCEVELSVDPAWSPAEIGLSGDARRLGVAVGGVSVQSQV